MRREEKDKRLALFVSLAVHGALFVVLAAAGVFTFIQTRSQAEPIDVTVYNEDSINNLPKLGGGDGGPTYEAPASPMPAIDESYTEEVQEQREVQKIMAETGVDAAQAKEIAAAHKPQSAAGQGLSSDRKGRGAGQGASGSGSEPGSGGSAVGIPGGDGLRPATKARLVSVPDVNSYYPEELRRKNIGGTVTVHIVVSADGSVASASVSASSGYAAMDEAAVQIAYGCVYEPAQNSYGQAVASERELNIPFRIR